MEPDRPTPSSTTSTTSSTSSPTTSCGSCSCAAIRRSPPTPRSRSRCGCSAGSTPPRSPAPSWSPSRRSPSASCGPSASCATTTPRTASRAPAELPDRLHAVLDRDLPDLHRGPHRDLRRRASRASTSPTRRSASDGCSSSSCPTSPRPSGCSRSMLLTDARRPARTAADGSMVRLADQDRTRWDRALIAEGHALVRACLRRNQPGPFQIQAAIAAVHADAATADATDWSPDRRAVRPAATRCARTPWSRSTGPSPSASCDGAAAGLAALDALDGPEGSTTTSRTTRRAPTCSRAPVVAPTRPRPTTARSS